MPVGGDGIHDVFHLAGESDPGHGRGEACRLLNCRSRRHGQYVWIGDDIDQRGTVISQRLFDGRSHISRVFNSDAEQPDGLRLHRGEVGVLRLQPYGDMPATSISRCTIPSVWLLKTMILTGRSC